MADKQSRISILLDINAKGFDAELSRAQRKLQKFGGQMKTLGRGLTVGLTAPLALVGAKSLQLAVDFEKSMAKVKAISGATTEEFNDLAASARDFGASTAFTASEVAGLQLELSKLGFKPQEILDATQGVLDLAFAFDNDLSETAAIAASTLNQFGLDASETGRVADLMAAAFSNSALDLNTFGEAMSKAGPVARAAGLDIKETTAILGILANNGIKGSDAGTKLKIALTEIRKAGLPVKTTLKQIADGSFDFEAGLALLGKRAEILNPILGSNKKKLAEFTDALDNSRGALGGAVDIMEETADGALKKMNSALQGAGESLGKLFLPLVVKTAEMIAGLADSFRDWSDSGKMFVAVIGVMLAAIGPFLFALGSMSAGVAIALPALTSLISTLYAVGAAAWAATGPFAPLVAVLAVAAGSIAYVAGKWNEEAEATRDAIRANKEFETSQQKVNRLLGRDVDTSSVSSLTAAIEDLEKQLEETAPEVDQALGLETFATAASDATGMTGAMANEVAFLNDQLGIAEDAVVDNTAALDDNIDRQGILADLLKAREDLLKANTRAAQEEADKLAANVSDAIKDYEKLNKVQGEFFNLGLGEGKAEDNLKSMQGALRKIVEEQVLAGQDATYWADQLQAVNDRLEELQKLEPLEPLKMKGRMELDEPTLQQSPDFSAAADRGEKSYRALAVAVRDVGDAIKNSVDVAGIFSNALGGAFDQIFSGAKTAGEAMLEMAANVISAVAAQVSAMMIQAAVQTALAGGPAAAVIAPALIGVGLGIASSAMAQVPAFAEGGAVLGPTLALVGEKPGSKGEAIIPFEKIGQFVDQVSPNQQASAVVVTGRISGSDIALSNSRGSVARSRRR